MRQATDGRRDVPDAAVWERVAQEVPSRVARIHRLRPPRRMRWAPLAVAASLLLLIAVGVQWLLGVPAAETQERLAATRVESLDLGTEQAGDPLPARRLDAAVYEGVAIQEGTPGEGTLLACFRC